MAKLSRITSMCGFLLGRTIQCTSAATNFHVRRQNSLYSTENEISVTIPCAVRPSPCLIAKSKNKNIFLRLLFELELLYGAVEKKLPTYFTDNNWMKYTQITNVIERCCYLHQLYVSRKEIEEKQKIKMDREMETNEGFSTNALFYFGREDFKRFTYELFGCRLLAAWRCKDSFPPLLIDCCHLADLNYMSKRALTRQMKDLVLDNSLQRNPFPVVFANYHGSIDIAEDVVNSWLRKRCLPKYRPYIANENKGNFAKELNHETSNERTRKLICAPFVPIVTSATIRECLGNMSSEEIAYINQRAAEYLPGPVSKYKAFVLCATPDNKLMNSAFKAANVEQLNSYKLPLAQFLNLGQTPVTMPLRIMANVIRDVYVNDFGWKIAFEKHIPYFNTLVGDMYRNHNEDKETLQVVEKWILDSEKRGKQKKKFFHLYSREERRAARAVLAEHNLLDREIKS
uniref:SAM-dependent MTase TRM10-type domain-containing protein n=1 Tax=Setaria digitata TaxID=48799 RepID=A0A915PGF3_9BILA